jgi:hypothetical protein
MPDVVSGDVIFLAPPCVSAPLVPVSASELRGWPVTMQHGALTMPLSPPRLPGSSSDLGCAQLSNMPPQSSVHCQHGGGMEQEQCQLAHPVRSDDAAAQEFVLPAHSGVNAGTLGVKQTALSMTPTMAASMAPTGRSTCASRNEAERLPPHEQLFGGPPADMAQGSSHRTAQQRTDTRLGSMSSARCSSGPVEECRPPIASVQHWVSVNERAVASHMGITVDPQDSERLRLAGSAGAFAPFRTVAPDAAEHDADDSAVTQAVADLLCLPRLCELQQSGQALDVSGVRASGDMTSPAGSTEHAETTRIGPTDAAPSQQCAASTSGPGPTMEAVQQRCVSHALCNASVQAGMPVQGMLATLAVCRVLKSAWLRTV